MSLLHTKNPQQKQKNSNIVLYIVLLFGFFGISFVTFPTLQNTVSIPKVFMLYGVSLLGIFIWLIQTVISKTIRLRKTSLDIPALVSVGVFLVSSLLSVIPSVSFLGKMDVFVFHTMIYVSFVVWTWLCIQAITTTSRWNGLLQAYLLVGAVHAGLFILHSYISLPFFDTIGSASLFTTSGTLLSIYMATLFVLSLGQLLPKHTSLLHAIFPALCAIIATVAIFRIGFATGFITLAVGMAFLIILGTAYLSEVRSSIVIVSFSVFVLSVLLLIFGVPNIFSTSMLPLEVSIGNTASWQVVKSGLLSGADQFLLGSGPGTFLQTFSSYRDVGFNVSQIAWTVRFNTPYNMIYAIVSEVGVFGIISFLVLVVGALGLVLHAWNTTRPSSHEGISVSTTADTVRIQVFVVVSAWIALTVSMCVTYFNVAIWCMWWTLLALSITGIATFLPQTIQERRWSMQLSPQYSLVLSFVLVMVATGSIVVGAFGTRILLADVAFSKALQSSTIEETADHLDDTLRLRANYVPYNLAHARLALQRARAEAQSAEPNADIIANHLAIAVNTARIATDKQGKNVETWETLASMYMNAQSLVPEANKWAIESLERALELESSNPIFYWQLGNAQVFAENVEAAEESYKQAIRLKPDYIVAYVSLSELLESQERYDQAIAVYQPIFRIIENNAEALFTLGRLFYNRQSENDLERAETVLLRAIELSPNYANARFTLGLVYEQLGNTAAAREQFQIVDDSNPGNQSITAKLRALNSPPPTPESTAPIE